MQPTGKKIEKCPCCGNIPHPLYEIHRFKEPFLILRCGRCGLQMQSIIPTTTEKYYEKEYYTGENEYAYRDERNTKPFDDFVFFARLKKIAKFVPPPADFVDIGCAFGGFVDAAVRFGYSARGIDISPYAANEGQKRGLNLICGELNEKTLRPRSTDILTLIEVIEHLPDPSEAFRVMQNAVRPGGVVILQTANFLGLQAQLQKENYHYYLPGHLFYYSTENLKMLFRRNGFSRVIFFRPVDFGLLPKLLKSRGSFQKPLDYLRWFRIAFYHLIGHVAFGNFALTSSLCVYAIRDK